MLENGGRKLDRDPRRRLRHVARRTRCSRIERHATSKIRDFDDLTHVRTLGFRGEALPSIAIVSRFTLTTSDDDSGAAIEIECDPLTGQRTVRPAARDRGTTIAVRELFENVPARRKFLRSADAEFRAIVTVVSSYALPLPRARVPPRAQRPRRPRPPPAPPRASACCRSSAATRPSISPTST